MRKIASIFQRQVPHSETAVRDSADFKIIYLFDIR